MNPNWRKELPPCTEHQRCQQASAQTCGESGSCQRRRDVARYSRATKKPSCFWTTCTRNKLFLTSQSGDAEIPRADVWRTELLCLVASLLPPPPLPPTVNFSISHICPDPHWAPVTAPNAGFPGTFMLSQHFERTEGTFSHQMCPLKTKEKSAETESQLLQIQPFFI